MSKNRYFFLHIPKTAGTSMHRLLETVAGPYVRLNHPHELQWSASKLWERFRGCGGHTDWAAARRFGFAEGFCLTFLRDPVERVLSQYAFSQDASHGDRPESRLARSNALRNLLQKTSGQLGAFWNAQTLALSGLRGGEHSPEKHLESALATLEKLDFIGTIETFSEDAAELARLLGCTTPVPAPHENRTAQRQTRFEIDEETRTLLEETQAMDQVLFARARELRAKRKTTTFTRIGENPSGWPGLPAAGSIGGASITQVEVKMANGQALTPGSEAEITINLTLPEPITGATLGIRIEDLVGNYIAGTNTNLLTGNELNLPKGKFCCSFRFPLYMGAGRYTLETALHRSLDELCWLRPATAFEVHSPNSPYREGMVDLVAKFRVGPRVEGELFPPESIRRLRLSLVAPLELATTPEAILVPVQLVNECHHVLFRDDPALIFASYHWCDSNASVCVFDGARTQLPTHAWPNEILRFSIHVLPPPHPGRWRLQVRLVQEGVQWLEGPGFENVAPSDIHIDFREDSTIVLNRETPSGG